MAAEQPLNPVHSASHARFGGLWRIIRRTMAVQPVGFSQGKPAHFKVPTSADCARTEHTGKRRSASGRPADQNTQNHDAGAHHSSDSKQHACCSLCRLGIPSGHVFSQPGDVSTVLRFVSVHAFLQSTFAPFACRTISGNRPPRSAFDLSCSKQAKVLRAAD